MTLDPLWSQYAFETPRAFGPALSTGTLRVQAEDFIIEEELGFAPTGTGQHVLLKVRKRDANTQWVARELAKVCRCRAMEVGYAGLKDRHALATQWFTVPHSAQSVEDWLGVRGSQFEVLEAHPHTRKLPRGALAGNRFTVRVRDVSVSDAELTERIGKIAQRGVPNFFGPQRFGNSGANLMRVLAAARGDTVQVAGMRALWPAEREFVLSAARSLIFNGVLTARVRDGSWERLRAGDLANLDGRGSVFAVDEVDDSLAERNRQLDIHPTGPMWGTGLPTSKGEVRELETRVAAQVPEAMALVEEAGMKQERRSLRMAIRALSWVREDARTIGLQFRLAKGSFATTVLREIFD